MQSPTLATVPVVVLAIGVLIGAIWDIRKFRVPNALTIPLLLSGLIYHATTGGWPGLGNSAVGMLFGFGSLIVFYLMGGIGAGDVKLMAAIGAWLGMPLTMVAFFGTAAAGGVYAVGLMVLNGGLRDTWLGLQLMFMRLAVVSRHLGEGGRLEAEIRRSDARRRLVPYAAMMFVGLLATFVWVVTRPQL